MRGSRPFRCEQAKADGTRCAAYATAGSAFCFFHDPAKAAARAAARRAGGRKFRGAVLPPATPDRPLDTVSDVVALLGETINQVRRGALAPRVATAVGYLAGLLLKGLEQRTDETGTAGRPVRVEIGWKWPRGEPRPE